MIITCESCSTSFNLDESLLKPEGSKVRCSNCKTVFLAYPPSSSPSPSVTGNAEDAGGGHRHSRGNGGRSGDGRHPFQGAAAVAAAEEPGDVAVSDEVLPEKLMEMDEDAIAQMLKLDETLLDTAETPSSDAVPEDGDALLDLPLDLDLNFGDDGAEATAGVEEIDLSELEQVLDGGEAAAPAEADGMEPEPELKLAIDEDDGAVVPAASAEETAEEIDLSELEAVLDEGETPPSVEDEGFESELSLALDTDEAEGQSLEPGPVEDRGADFSELEAALAESEGPALPDEDTVETVSGLKPDTDGHSQADGPAVGDTDEIDLSELEQALEGLEEEPSAGPDESGSNAALDEADLDLAPETSEIPADNVEELNLSELEQALAAAEGSSGIDGRGEPLETSADDAQELDLSELEDALAETGEASPLMSAGGADEEEALSLELSGEAADEPSVAPDAGEPMDLDDLEKALEIDDADDGLPDLSLERGGETETAAADEGENPEEIDLTDIEELLESDQGFAAAAAAPALAEEADDGEEGIDISEIEEVLTGSAETGTEGVAEAADEDLDLDFDIEEEPVAEESAQEAFFSEDASDFEFEEDDIEIAEVEADASREEEAMETAAVDADEPVVADTVGEESSDASGGSTDSGAFDGVSGAMPAAAVAAAGTAVAPVAATRAARRGGGGRILLWMVVLLLLVAGGYVAYSFYPGKHIAGIPKLGELNIPYVSPLFESGRQVDPGNLRIKTVGVTSRFVDNAKAGRLFVISGKVINRYPEPRRDIRIVGRLYAKGKKLVQTRNVMGGAVVSDLELSRLDAGGIAKRLSGRGPVLKPGQSQPFMIVFSNLPDNLEEFTIEVAGSKK